MNREKMIEAITTAILGKTAPKAAAAVLDLCGPKPLVWDGSAAYMTAETQYGAYTIEQGNRPDKSLWCGWLFQTYDDGQSTYFNGIDAIDVPEAQAAAQSHADAAHWANTVIGASQ